MDIETRKPRQKWAMIERASGQSDHHLAGTTPKLEMRRRKLWTHQKDVSFPKLKQIENFSGSTVKGMS
jgi:hypothetical protein